MFDDGGTSRDLWISAGPTQAQRSVEPPYEESTFMSDLLPRVRQLGSKPRNTALPWVCTDVFIHECDLGTCRLNPTTVKTRSLASFSEREWSLLHAASRSDDYVGPYPARACTFHSHSVPPSNASASGLMAVKDLPVTCAASACAMVLTLQRDEQ